MRAPNKHQRKMHSRTLGTSIGGGCGRASIPAAHDKAQAGTHVRPGSICRSAPPSGLTQFLPVRTGGGFGSRLFSHSSCARHLFPLRAAAHRRADVLSRRRPAAFHVVHDGRIGELCYAARLPDQFARAVMAARRQFSFSDHVPAKFADRSEAHLRSPFRVPFQHRNDDTHERPKSWKRQPTRTAP
jgi:hypothetical protein